MLGNVHLHGPPMLAGIPLHQRGNCASRLKQFRRGVFARKGPHPQVCHTLRPFVLCTDLFIITPTQRKQVSFFFWRKSWLLPKPCPDLV